MKLLVTDNLVSDLSQLDSFNINLEKISIKDISNQAQSLFDDDKFKLIFDEFITISSFNKLKIDLDDNYIFQIKKSNLSKFTSLGSEVDVLYLDSQKVLLLKISETEINLKFQNSNNFFTEIKYLLEFSSSYPY